MLQSFVVTLREGTEAALIIAILLSAVRRLQRRDLERAVWSGLGLAVLASLAAAVALQRLPVTEEIYEGTLYWVSAAFVASMLWWMHRKSRSLRNRIEQRVSSAALAEGGSAGEAWGLGAFAFLMLFREGAETVLFLTAVNLTTQALLGLLGAALGLAVATVFGVLVIRGGLRVDLRRFFAVTEWVLALFLVQLVVNGYHELAEARLLPEYRWLAALMDPLVEHEAFFAAALVAIPLLLWLSGKRSAGHPRPGTDPGVARQGVVPGAPPSA